MQTDPRETGVRVSLADIALLALLILVPVGFTAQCVEMFVALRRRRARQADALDRG